MTDNTNTFKDLVQAIRRIHDHLSAHASQAVNVSLTLRNWLIGGYIAEYELNGSDRAAYGEKLLVSLAQTLSKERISGLIVNKLKCQCGLCGSHFSQVPINFKNRKVVNRKAISSLGKALIR